MYNHQVTEQFQSRKGNACMLVYCKKAGSSKQCILLSDQTVSEQETHESPIYLTNRINGLELFMFYRSIEPLQLPMNLRCPKTKQQSGLFFC